MFNLNLVPTEIVIPDVKKLRVTPVNPPFNMLIQGNNMVFQKIYYQLVRVYEDNSEKVIEDANLDIPFFIYSKLALFVDNSITEEDLFIINGFFAQNGWSNIQVVMPEIVEQPLIPEENINPEESII